MSNQNLLARFRQASGARRKRGIDFTKALEEAEQIANVNVVITPATPLPFEVVDILVDPDGKKLAFFAQGGEPGQEYSAEFTVITSGTQRFVDVVKFDIW